MLLKRIELKWSTRFRIWYASFSEICDIDINSESTGHRKKHPNAEFIVLRDSDTLFGSIQSTVQYWQVKQ